MTSAGLQTYVGHRSQPIQIQIHNRWPAAQAIGNAQSKSPLHRTAPLPWPISQTTAIAATLTCHQDRAPCLPIKLTIKAALRVCRCAQIPKNTTTTTPESQLPRQ